MFCKIGSCPDFTRCLILHFHLTILNLFFCIVIKLLFEDILQHQDLPLFVDLSKHQGPVLTPSVRHKVSVYFTFPSMWCCFISK